MSTAPQTALSLARPSLQVPRIQLDDDRSARVVRWGMVDGTLLRPGDRLVACASPGPLVLLAPHGMGRPMLAVREGRQLLALPGRVPASPARWRVVSSIRLVERELERGAPDDGSWTVAVRLEALRADADLAGAARALAGDVGALSLAAGQLDSRQLDARQLDALCLRASLAPRRYGVAVAVCATRDPALAPREIQDVPVGCIRFELAPGEARTLGRVIQGPWASPAAEGRSVALQPAPVGGTRQVLLPFTAGVGGG